MASSLGSFRLFGGLLAVFIGLASAGRALADQIVVRGGGTLKGVVVPGDPAKPDQIAILTAASRQPMYLPKDRVLKVIPQPGPLTDYLERRARVDAEPSAQAHFDLARWCEKNRLTGPAQIHFNEAVRLDPEHGEAHKALGHVLYDGRWMTYDQMKQAQGLVKVDGKWVTRDVQTERDDRVQDSTEQAGWRRRIQVYRELLLRGRPDEVAQAESQLRAIDDPNAVLPLVGVLGQDSPQVRMLLDETLGGIPGPAASRALADRVLTDPDSEVVRLTLNELARREDPAGRARLLDALRASNPEIVGRAAQCLAGLNERSAVPRLIPALLYSRRDVVWEPVPGSGMSTMNPAVGSSNGLFMGNGPSIAVLQPPVTAPGVAAFGATAVPWWQAYNQAGTYVGAPSATGATQPQMRARPVTVFERNVEVLDALVKLTGKNFGYDPAAWQAWLRSEFRSPAPQPAREVPQP